MADQPTLDANKLLSRRAIQLWSGGDIGAAADLFAADYVNHQHGHPDAAADVRGLEAWKAFLAEFRGAFPDFRDSIQLQVAEGDFVVTRFVSSGTQRGRFLGLAPTGRHAEWTGTTTDRIVGGRIAESWGNWDMMGMLQQLGLVSWPA